MPYKDRDKINASARKRYAANRAKRLAQSKKWRQANPEKWREIIRKWRAANPERERKNREQWNAANAQKLLEQARAWRAANPEKVAIAFQKWKNANPETPGRASQRWAKEHPEKVAHYASTRRARKKNTPKDDLTHAQWVEIQEVYNHCCVYCGRRAKGHLTQDHLTPLSKGGENTASNVVPACSSCNSKKKAGPVLAPVQPLLLTVAEPKKKKAS